MFIYSYVLKLDRSKIVLLLLFRIKNKYVRRLSERAFSQILEMYGIYLTRIYKSFRLNNKKQKEKKLSEMSLFSLLFFKNIIEETRIRRRLREIIVYTVSVKK